MLLLTNGTIATMDPARPMAEAAVVDGAYFAYVGGRADAEDFARRFSRGAWETLDLQGRFVMPGFNDSHLHFIHYVKTKLSVNLFGCTSLAEVQERLRRGLAGLEFAHGIPGTLGGGVMMNAGAYGGELSQTVTAVTYLDGEGEEHTLPAAGCEFGYRSSIFARYPDWLILKAEFSLPQGDPEEIRGKIQELARRRGEKQPLEYPSAGSMFKRPEGHFAAALIDQCGLKGLTVGGAQVSEKHAGFVINRGGATCADVLQLVRQVQARVLEQTGVTLKMEVKVLR